MVNYRPLGKTGLQVTGVGFGCGHMASLTVEAGIPLVQRAIELGINYFDTARGYGETEVMLGQVLRGQRDRAVISTKTTGKTRDDAWRSILESLQRLQTDHVDNCHIHGINEGADMDQRLGKGGALEALIEARAQGLVRHIGVTSHTSRALLRALERFDFETILVPMNLVEREPLAELIPLCQRRAVGVTIMKPVGTGLLPGPIALKWLLNQPLSATVPGFTTLEELELDAPLNSLADEALTPDEQAQVDALVTQWDHKRCRICSDCMPCPQNIAVPIVLGTEVMYCHYRTLGAEAFAAAAWSPEVMDRDMHSKEKMIAAIEACDHCGQCEVRCPHGLPAMEMLEDMLPALRDILRIYQQRLGVTV